MINLPLGDAPVITIMVMLFILALNGESQSKKSVQNNTLLDYILSVFGIYFISLLISYTMFNYVVPLF